MISWRKREDRGMEGGGDGRKEKGWKWRRIASGTTQ
jgi:hypothetical protein